MGLFIWNDKSWMFVENRAAYEIKEFVIVRKLFIKWMIQNGEKCLKNEIKRGFRLYGPIEKIDIIKTSNEIADAYVLYENSQSAFQAFIATRNGIILPQLQQIVPADTWHQPDAVPMWLTKKSGKSSMLKLNDDCLLEIFKFFDFDDLIRMSNVCVRFKQLLDEFCFPKIKVHTAFVHHASLNQLRQTMKCIGPHLVNLCLRYQNYSQKRENYLEREHVERATYKILQNVSKNLIKFTVRQPQGQKLSHKLIEVMAPVLSQITFLEWDVDFDCDTIRRLHELCPRLETLVLRKRTFSCECNHTVANLHWASLRSIDVFQYMATLNAPCQRFFEQFIQANPQLIRLKLTNVNDDLLRVVTKFAKNLQHLEMLQNFDLCGIHSEPTLHLLRNLQNLKIFIIRVKSTEFLSEVENQIKCLSQIKQLELVVLLRNYSPPVWPPERFPYAHYYASIAIEDRQMQLQIGDNTMNCTFPEGNTTLVNIINSNNPSESSYLNLQREIVYMFELSNDFFPECQKSITFKNSDCYQYIHISRNV